MKVVVLGAGLMGREIARDLLTSENVEKVFLADLNIKATKDFVNTLNTDRIEAVELNAEDDQNLRTVMSKGEVSINALFYSFNEKVARTALEIGVHSVDLGGHIGEVTDKVLALSDEANSKGLTLIPDLGVAPGMINILTGYGASKLDKVESIKLYVGGIPTKPVPPLNYSAVFSLEGVMDHYTEPSKVIQQGELKEVPSLSGIESIYFSEFGMLEAFYTSGGTSTLPKTFPNVKTLEYKTIRYKGHAEKFQLLADLGLFDKQNVVDVDGSTVKVRNVVREVLKKKLALGDEQDAVLLRVIVAGQKSEEVVSYEYEMVVRRDEASHMTAMARATACTISAVAQMIGNGHITKRGVLPPETVVPGDRYIEEMAKRGVIIKETSHRSTIVKW